MPSSGSPARNDRQDSLSIEGLQRLPADLNPGIAAPLVKQRAAGRGKRHVGKCADRNRDHIRFFVHLVLHDRSTVRAKAVGGATTFISGPLEGLGLPLERDL